jgi:4-hydroxy-tetrahydrodipicolinate reductase
MMAENKIKIAIVGADGRMGRVLLELIAADDELELASAIETTESRAVGKRMNSYGKDIKITADKENGIKNADCIIDFSTIDSSMETLELCKKYTNPLILGTTGFSPEQTEKINEGGKLIPMFFSPNMSIGINLLFRLVREVSAILNKSYDIEIMEIHHNKKLDAPSGTALKFKNEILKGTKSSDDNIVFGRSGQQKRIPGEIGIHAVRAGNIVGEHTILFAGNDERIELKHVAQSRNAFAGGAIFAAKYLVRKMKNQPGCYSFEDLFKSL